MPKVTVFRKAHFNAAHRLFNKDWSDQKNAQVFGKCSNPYYHGHNYDLVVSLTGEVDKETGFVYDLGRLKYLIQDHIVKTFDHKNLNEEVEEFSEMNPTAENISIVIYQKLRRFLPKKLELTVRLYETPRNFVEYKGE